MKLDDLIWPRLSEELKGRRMVWILGHQRSGTTNVHKAVASLPSVQTGTFFDLFFVALTLKYLMWPILGPVNRLYLYLSGFSVSNHNYGMLEELEEHLYMLYQFGGEVITTVLFPDLGSDPEFLHLALQIQPDHFEFVNRAVARILHFNRSSVNKVYVGCPLGFSQAPLELTQHFPASKVIVCVRNPVSAFPSFVDLISALTKQQYGQIFTDRIRVLYQVYSSAVYRALAAAVDTIPDDKIYWLDFEGWKSDSPKQLRILWDFLELDSRSADLNQALRRSEHHTNRPESYTVIDPEQIKRELGVHYEKMLSACSRMKPKAN
eukprot:TRINITY_DN19404_c0_g1_i7.p1 TRINITY_DN19404_c0_g1~~TRINITY_DN19404_c0_g1_i7.p1  ORF type:complete len:321 (+),score=71.09 TRINITY_DN19404_c0_g1_i7:280-1242(+)